MNFLHLLLFHFVYCYKNYDIELEGKMTLDSDFLHKLKNDLKYNRKLTFEKRRTEDVKVPLDISKYLVLVIDNGIKKLNHIGRYLQRKLNIKDDLSSTVARLEKDFEKKMKTYAIYAVKDEVECDIDKEYLFLDMVSFSNIIMHSEAKMLLNTVVEKKMDNITDADVQIVTETIYKEHIDHMREEMNFLCEKLNICRPYPGFSEYFADLLSEILKLSDDQLTKLAKIMKEKIEERTNFFKSFIKEDVADMIGFQLEALSLDLYNVKKLLAVVRSIIAQRYKLVKTGEVELKMRTKAVRILLDIIDKAFNSQTDELTAITFDTTVKAIRQWQTGARTDINLPLRLFIEHVVNILRNNWDLRTREEVMMLTEIMVVGKTEDPLYEDLFSKGSAFVRNPVEPSDQIWL